MGLGTQRITQSLNVYTSRIHPELYFSMHQDDSDEQSEGDDWFRRPPHQCGDDLVLVSVQDCRIQEASIKAVVPCRCLSIIASTTMRA
jgi:hypothetical protein